MDDSKKNKSSFDWQKGGVIDDTNSQAVPEVRQKGLPKIKQAVSADPEKRKQEREKFILENQTQVYKSSDQVPKSDKWVLEESQSGLSKTVQTDKAKKLISSEDPIRSKFFAPKSKDNKDDSEDS